MSDNASCAGGFAAPSKRGWLALVGTCVAMLVATLALAESRPTLAGSWSAGPLVERYNIGEWGAPCGPRPVDHDFAGGPAEVHEEGDELAIVAEGRTFRTTDCWEQLPGVGRSSHTATDRSWQTGCQSAPDDARQTVLVTSIKASDSTIFLDEVAQYQFRIEGQNCTASARRTRTWSLVQRQGERLAEAAPAASGRPTAAVAKTAQPVVSHGTPPAEDIAAPEKTSAASADRSTAARCTTSGPAMQVEVRPARKLLRPGERFTFRTTAVDANGCPVDPRATWTLGNSSTKVSVIPGGTVVVDDDATDGTAELLITAAGRSTQVNVEVATPSRYEALLAPAATDAATDEPAAIIATGASLGASSATAQDTAHTRKTIFVVLIGVLALGLAALGLVLVRRAPLASAALDRSGSLLRAPVMQGPPPKPGNIVIQARGGGAARGMICPSCRTEFPPKSVFCPHDGNRLVPAGGGAQSFQGPTIGPPGGICPTCGRGYDPGVKTCPAHGDDLVPVAVYRATAHRTASAAERGKICPSCGGRYGGEATFCGKDGTALVLVN